MSEHGNLEDFSEELNGILKLETFQIKMIRENLSNTVDVRDENARNMEYELETTKSHTEILKEMLTKSVKNKKADSIIDYTFSQITDLSHEELQEQHTECIKLLKDSLLSIDLLKETLN